MATSKPTRLTQLVLGASVITATVMGGYKLYISGNQYVSGNVGFTGSASGTSLNIYGSGATTDLRTSKTTGRVGIGLISTEIPETKFEVRGTASGLILNGGGGTTVIDSNIETHGTASGSRLEVNKVTSGSGIIRVSGPDGGGDCFLDSDAAGWTQCSYLDGVQTCATVASC